MENLSYDFSSINKFIEWIHTLSTEEGNRNSTVVKIVTEGLGQGFNSDFIKIAVETYCDKSGLSHSEAHYIIERYIKKHSLNPFDSNHNPKESKKADWPQLTKEFLKSNYSLDGKWVLAIWNDDFYLYEDNKYRRVDDSEVKGRISRFIIEKGFLFKGYKPSVIQQEIISTLYGMILIPKNLDAPFFDPFLGTGSFVSNKQLKRNFIVMQNGVLDLDSFLKDETVYLRSHSANYFSLTKLPFDFNLMATSPRWQEFLETTFDDKGVIDLFQEWFGYNLINHTNYQKFLLAVGHGSNGKSVLLKVLSLMLGEGNYASIGLENFDPKRTFPLANLNGMMANIVNDLNEIHKTGEGLLKQFVSGEPITVERKYKDPFIMKPTAKLTMATNVKPHFMDRTDGIWRRLIMVTFKNQILDPLKQDRRLMSDEWWQQSGELPGILNWALEGLKRLENIGMFTMPETVKEDIRSYRLELNAAATFLASHIEVNSEGEIYSHWLYRDYCEFCLNNGFKPLGAHKFAEEVKRSFPNVNSTTDRLTRDPREIDKRTIKSRCWQGISYCPPPETVPNPFF